MDEQTSSEEHSTDSGESNELYNPDASLAAILGDMQNTTPKIRRMQGSSTASSQKSAALAVDPNGGRCLLTRERIPTVAIQACHLLAQATKPPQLTQLEWHWGLPHLSLNVDSSRNLFYLRSDLHLAFDANNWLLVPDSVIVDKIYERVQTYNDPDKQLDEIKALYGSENTFEYRLLPGPELQSLVIFRREPDNFEAPNETDISMVGAAKPKYASHHFPFESIGPLSSHVHPHFVLWNSGKKLATMDLTALSFTAAAVLGIELLSALMLLNKVSYIYTSWTSKPAPRSFHRDTRLNLDPSLGSGGGSHDDNTRRYPSRNTRKPGQKSHRFDGGPQGSANVGHSLPLFSPIDNAANLCNTIGGEISIVYPDGMEECGSDWEANISQWANESSKVPTGEGAPVVNDSQIGRYAEERARSPRQESWCTWRAPWIRSNVSKHLPNKQTFSSNDWAVYHESKYLTD